MKLRQAKKVLLSIRPCRNQTLKRACRRCTSVDRSSWRLNRKSRRIIDRKPAWKKIIQLVDFIRNERTHP